MLKYARINTFYRYLRPFQARMRKRRSEIFIRNMKLREGLRVIDLGGTPEIWQFIDTPLDITLVNLEYDPKTDVSIAPQHKFTLLEEDACKLDLPSCSFDVAFSNSVIEHVGDDAHQRAFASEVRRIAPSYWVQTPSKWFPIEAHNGMPFWWFYPERVRQALIRSWREKLPAWTEMIEGTTVLEKSALREMFPDATLVSERYLGLVKSYIAYKVA